MSDKTPFRRSLLLKLVGTLVIYGGALTLMIRYEGKLGAATIPTDAIIICCAYYFFKLLLVTGWNDAFALPLERIMCRALIYLQVIGIVCFVTLKMYELIKA